MPYDSLSAAPTPPPSPRSPPPHITVTPPSASDPNLNNNNSCLYARRHQQQRPHQRRREELLLLEKLGNAKGGMIANGSLNGTPRSHYSAAAQRRRRDFREGYDAHPHHHQLPHPRILLLHRHNREKLHQCSSLPTSFKATTPHHHRQNRIMMMVESNHHPHHSPVERRELLNPRRGQSDAEKKEPLLKTVEEPPIVADNSGKGGGKGQSTPLEQHQPPVVMSVVFVFTFPMAIAALLMLVLLALLIVILFVVSPPAPPPFSASSLSPDFVLLGRLAVDAGGRGKLGGGVEGNTPSRPPSSRPNNPTNSFGSEGLVRLPRYIVPTRYHLDVSVMRLPLAARDVGGGGMGAVEGRKGEGPLANAENTTDVRGPKELSFDASLRIHFTMLQTSKLIVLHAKNLKIDPAHVWIRGDDNKGSDILTLISPHFLHHHRNYTLLVEHYSGLVNRPHEGGLFLTHYERGGGGENPLRHIVATQMQPLDARRLLPCWDEPQLKAVFEVAVIHPLGTNAVSNTPLRGEPQRQDHNGEARLRSEFMPTPRMSTYLLALAITDFSYREHQLHHHRYGNSSSPSQTSVTVRLWAPPTTLPHTEHALNVAIKSLDYFGRYFNIAYPLRKLDIVAVPSLRVAAMENWGLVFCRPQSLFYSPDVQPKRDRQFVTDVLAHEIAHMWFGNLVTMEWWDDLWLNEGFATLMGMKAADHVEGTRIRQRQLFYERTIKAFRFDQLGISHQQHAAVHPLSWPITRVRDVSRRFDPITYLKAAAVLRMVEGVLGEEAFRRGLSTFLARFSYGSARAAHLTEALSEGFTASQQHLATSDNSGNKHLDLGEFLHSWTHHTGFPLIRMVELNQTHIWAEQSVFSIYNHSVGQKLPEARKGETLWMGDELRERNETSVIAVGEVEVKTKVTADVVWTIPLFVGVGQDEYGINAGRLTEGSGVSNISKLGKENAIVRMDNNHEMTMRNPIVWMGEKRRGLIISNFPTTNPTATFYSNYFTSFLVDSQVRGYYRVLYSPRQYAILRQLLLTNHSAIPVAQRARLLEDALTLAKHGQLDFPAALGLCEYLEREEAYLPLLVFNNHLHVLYLLMRNHPQISLLRAYLIRLLEPIYHRVISSLPSASTLPPENKPKAGNNDYLSTKSYTDIGSRDEDDSADLRGTLREFAMSQLCYWDFAPCIEHARQMFVKLMSLCRLSAYTPALLSDIRCNPIEPALRAPTYAAAISHGGEEEFEYLMTMYRREPFAAERNRILAGLASTANLTRLLIAIEELHHGPSASNTTHSEVANTTTTTSTESFRRASSKVTRSSQESEEVYLQFLLKLFRSPILDPIIAHMRAELGKFLSTAGEGKPSHIHPQVAKIWLTYVTRWVATEEELAALAEFESTHSRGLEVLRLGDYLREQHLAIRGNIDFSYRHVPEIVAYVDRYFQEEATRGG